MRGPVRGCRDVFPASATSRRALITRFASLASRYGFAEVETPILERLDLYSAALGAGSDVVSSELFRASGPPAAASRGDRAALVLRPEGTAGVARACGARAAKEAKGAVGLAARVWYGGPMFRYERPQRMRLRQFTQVGVECFFEDGVGADFDCISLAKRLLDGEGGGERVELVVNTLGAREDRVGYNEALVGWLKPRKLALSPVSRLRLESGNCMRILDSKLSEDCDALQGAPLLSEFIGKVEKTRFSRLLGLLEEDGIPFRIDPMLVRGLDYYSSTAFEFQEVASGKAICAGGRYGDVQDVSGVGFAVGLERMEEVLLGDDGEVDSETAGTSTAQGAADLLGGTRGGVAVFALVGFEGSDGEREGALARSVVRRLRLAGFCSMLWTVRNSKVGKAVGRAAQSGTRAVVLVGPSDAEKNVVQVKLIEGTSHDSREEQKAVSVDGVVSHIRASFGWEGGEAKID